MALWARKATCVLLFVVMPLWNVALWTLYGAYAWARFCFGVTITPLGQFCLVCHLFVPPVETVHREEESHVLHRTSAPDVTLCGQELLIHGFCSLLLLRSTRQLSFFFPSLHFHGYQLPVDCATMYKNQYWLLPFLRTH